MSAQKSAGIQTLLDAEREASKIVQKAREFRTRRVKEARDDAKKEIAEYKASKDQEFKKFEAEVNLVLLPAFFPHTHDDRRRRADEKRGTQHSQGNKAAEDEASKEAEKQIKVIKEAGQKSQGQVVKNLLGAVFDVTPTAPEIS
ncbi:hypothetical protein RJ55_01532 [Drechmeria coniospora]|nr:hypothetical protein RJ55_01532 [Drechmeria coniospora]